MNKPELLAPAGSFEKAKTAFRYGADAVYLGGDLFSLRANANNLSLEDINEGVKYAHNLNKKELSSNLDKLLEGKWDKGFLYKETVYKVKNNE